ncbi:diguanylate cyclase [Actinocrispum wychmicini]|uniref:Diguanylate cyclase (GGDEF)-like protein n=1 Tax=Actinocrispum wychmicini TaxID=1213861 RepID=A0A4R2J7F8_9PSEU|nr:diguanylate cyclase [Actinocrispum wychmicini]TCO55031.1 diguanylate cyclase (GGDEF)-like protein [Actinocrispum wychmicini]
MSGRPPRPARAWLLYLAVGLGIEVVYYLVPASSGGVVARVVLYCLVSASASVAVFVGVWRNEPRPPLPWILLGLSQVVYASADAYFYVAHYLLGDLDYPSVADPLYLAHYPLVVAGLLLLIRQRRPGRDLPGVLDAAVLAVVAAMLSWLYVIGPQARMDSPILAKLASLGYPVMDLALLSVALPLVLGEGSRPRSFFLLTANLVGIMTADTIYVLQQLAGTYHAGNFLDAIWLTANLALGTAALDPTMSRVGEKAPPRVSRLGPVRIAVTFAAVLVAPATLVVQYVTDSLQDVLVVAVACAVLFLLTILRMVGLVAAQRKLAITDGLTGLYTRRFFEAQLPIELARARRANGSAAVLIIDVDRFKSINDRYGHPAGDRVLIEIAARLSRTVRSGEVLARYGGEEFALVVPNISEETLPIVAERLRAQVAAGPIAITQQTAVPVTVSVGTASYPVHGDTPGELVSMADRALYAAKASGRDRIVVTGLLSANGAPGPDVDRMLVDYLCEVADQVDGWLSSYEHSRAIGRWSTVLAERMGLDTTAVRCSEMAGRLHDVGKIVIPESVLRKPGTLAEDEWRLVRSHPDFGFRLARMLPGYDGVARVIRQHHERFDGQGYPEGLSGNEIRVEARLLGVCDAWAAMRSDRPYQPARTEDEARVEIRDGRGTQFDPDVADLFLDLHHKGLVGELQLIVPTADGLVLPPISHPRPR